MKFRYYIADTVNGEIYGTNGEDQARSYAQSDENYVLDAEKGKCFRDDEISDITEADILTFEDDEGEDLNDPE